MSFKRSAVDLLQGQWVLLILWVLLMWVGMVVMCGRSQMVTVMLLLLSVFSVMFATGPLLLFAREHSPLRALFETLL